MFPTLGDTVEAYKMAAVLYAVPISLMIGCIGAGLHNFICGARPFVASVLWQALSLLVLCSYWLWIALLQ